MGRDPKEVSFEEMAAGGEGETTADAGSVTKDANAATEGKEVE